MTTNESILLIGSGLLLLSIVSTKVSARLGIPALVVFLLVGILAGPEGIGGLTVNSPDAVQLLASFSLISILFSGGLDTEWRELRPVVGRGLLLATFGLFATAALVAVLMRILFPVSWNEALLFGSIISCTDVAAVFAALRSKRLRLAHGIGAMVEFESAANDPMAVFLALTLIGVIKTPSASLYSLVPEFFLQMGVGAVCGIILGACIPRFINWMKLEQDGLYPPLTIAMAVLTFSITNQFHGSGYLAVYIAGITMNRQEFLQKRRIIRFYDSLSWLSQILMFVSLGLILRPSALLPIMPQGLVISLFLVFIARPVATLVTLCWTRTPLREMLMISWLGLRGAVPIILASLTLYSGVASAALIFNLVFFVVVLSLLLQGTTLGRIARLLGVSIDSDKVAD